MAKTETIKKDEVKKEETKKEKYLLLTVGDEKTVYSEAVHGKNYKEIAEATRVKFNGVITEIE